MAEATSTLDKFLDPIAGCLTPEVARRIAELRTDEETTARLEALRAKANEGELSEGERHEYEQLVEGFDLLSIIKAKARAILANRDG